MSINALREAFEVWANAYWSQGLGYNFRDDETGEYVDGIVQDAWCAFRHAHKSALNSLCLGVDCMDDDGATISLMSRVGEFTTVLACGYTESGKSSFHKVVV